MHFKTMPPLRHRQVTSSLPGTKNVPALRHWQVSESFTLPFFAGLKLCPVASLADKEVMPHMHLPGR